MSRVKPKVGDSQFWTSILEVKEIFYKFCKKKLGDGKNTRFWEYVWVDEKLLKHAYPRLYFLTFDHNITVAQKGWHDFKFRRTLYGETLDLWNNLILRCEEVEMVQVEIQWNGL